MWWDVSAPLNSLYYLDHNVMSRSSILTWRDLGSARRTRQSRSYAKHMLPISHAKHDAYAPLQETFGN